MRLSRLQATVGLKVAVRIINAWDATPLQACRILRISRTTYRRVAEDSGGYRRLDRDQEQRISLVLAIHAILRTVFSNQSNVRGFTQLKNGNAFFEGRSPLEVMSQGDMVSLYQTYKHLEELKRPA